MYGIQNFGCFQPFGFLAEVGVAEIFVERWTCYRKLLVVPALHLGQGSIQFVAHGGHPLEQAQLRGFPEQVDVGLHLDFVKTVFQQFQQILLRLPQGDVNLP